jgi:hypothetical protein
MSARDQFRTQIKVVVNLSIQNNLNLPVFVTNGLVTARNIDDAQSSDRQPNTITYKKSAFIGSPMPNGIRHAFEGTPYFAALQRWIDDARYSTHVLSLSAHFWRLAVLSFAGELRHPGALQLTQCHQFIGFWKSHHAIPETRSLRCSAVKIPRIATRRPAVNQTNCCRGRSRNKSTPWCTICPAIPATRPRASGEN